MQTSTILDSLNPAQHDIVVAPPQNQLILAGAGSGKTRVLVHRIAWLIDHFQFSPHSILAVTFTNKAAYEMRGRIETMIGTVAKQMWIGTFHGLAHRLLRLHWSEAKLAQHFQVIDTDDQSRLIRRIIINHNIDEERWPAKETLWYINGKKEEGIRAAAIVARDPYERTQQRIYQAYENVCQQSSLVDFAELLLSAYELWQNNPELLKHYQERFRYILVDEFQDTNNLQYNWIRTLANSQQHVMIVGDDDQSIYGWRGARIENMQRFCRDYPNTSTVRLEQNYRSTHTILKAANALIANNAGRLGKNLWTAGSEGSPIIVYQAINDIDEARFVVERIRRFANEGHALNDMAILYRSNAQSRILEEALLEAQLAYRIYGGLRFFERAEIKDTLAYLRLLANPDDDNAFERIINIPTRGIGDRTVVQLREYALQHQISLWQATLALSTQAFFATRTQNVIKQFIDLQYRLQQETQSLTLPMTIESVLTHTGLIEHYRQEKGGKGLTRIENLEELINAAQQFSLQQEPSEQNELINFLAYAALESGEGQATSEDYVQLMTLHAAKGLEFAIVFLCGCEEGLFPHYMAIEEPGRLEEERRLCYVGITRARDKLFLTHAERRRLHGKEIYPRPSRFLSEIPEELLESARMKTKVTLPNKPIRNPSTMTTDTGIDLGKRISHPVFGVGIIIGHEGTGEHLKLQIRFDKIGTKWLMAQYVKPLEL